MSDFPVGQRFSQIYLGRGLPVRDSVRFRNRVRALFSDISANTSIDFGHAIEHETGSEVPRLSFGRDWSVFWTQSELRDVLDAITIISAGLDEKGFQNRTKQWCDSVERFFREENLGYRLDKRGGVHFAIDEIFEQERQATLAGLGSSQYDAVRYSFDQAFSFLDTSPPDTRSSVRAIFDAL